MLTHYKKLRNMFSRTMNDTVSVAKEVVIYV